MAGRKRASLASVIVAMLKDFVLHIGKHRVPIAQKKRRRRFAIQLAQQRLQFVSAVAVEEHDFMNAVVCERIDQIFDHQEQRRYRDERPSDHIGEHRNAYLAGTRQTARRE